MNKNSKQYILHFTGHDLAGKTSIAKELSKQIEIPYFRNPNNKNYFNQKNDFLNPVEYAKHSNTLLHAEGGLEINFLNQTGYSIIRDRSYICEMVYSVVYNRVTDLDFIRLLHESYCSIPGFFIIFCFKEFFNKKFEDDCVKEDEIEQLKTIYKAQISLLTHQEKIMWLDTTDEDLDLQILKIKDFIEWEKK